MQMDADEQPQRVSQIIQYWHEKETPADLAEYFGSFREMNPEMRHRVFSEASARSLIEEHFAEHELRAFDECAVPAMQADYFRYCAIYALGGIYCDADCRCIQPLRPMMEAGSQIFEGPERWHAHNEVFAFWEPSHPLLRLAIDIATTNVENRISEKVALVTGPMVFRMLIEWSRKGSDAWFEYARQLRTPAITADARHWRRHLDMLRDRVGDDAGIARAFEGVRVAPLSERKTYIRHGGSHLSYKQTEMHFPNFKSSIFR